MIFAPATHAGYKLFHDGQIALSQVEHNGMKIDVAYLDQKIKETDQKIKILSKHLTTDKDCQEVYKAWRQRYGGRTNLGSREQLGVVLFEVLKKPYPAMALPQDDEPGGTKRKFHADKNILEDVDLPFVRKFTAVEKLKKAKSTYLLGIRREVDSNGFLHPNNNLNTVATYRSSQSEPNTQNIPIRDEEVAKIIRPAFIPRHPSRQIAECDFSGIEVRVSACYNKDPKLLGYIRDPTTDMHRDMAMECYCLKRTEVNKACRYCAKNKFVFPQFYGDWYFSCAVSLWVAIDRMHLTTEQGVPLKEHLRRKGIKELGDLDRNAEQRPGTFIYHLKKVEEKFWKERFKVYDQWKWDWWNMYLEQGYFDTYTGFRCSGIMDRKQAVNYPIQGSAFHCLLWSLIRIQKKLQKYHMRTLIIGQIHDSVLADVAKGELKDYQEISHTVMTKDIMRHWPWLIVPLEAELEVSEPGKSWLEKHKVA